MGIYLRQIKLGIQNMSWRDWRTRAHILQKSAVRLSKTQAEDAVFCFVGEFGYELISWIPYLKYLAEDRGIAIRTISRPGSKLFYPFSKDHREHATGIGSECWGDGCDYFRLAELLNVSWDQMVFPCNDFLGRQVLAVAQATWDNQSIHAELDLSHYSRLKLKAPEHTPLPFQTDRPIALINNKNYFQWGSQDPRLVNSFSREELVEILNLLTQKGYFTVYNHFRGPKGPGSFELDDAGIFGLDSSSTTLDPHYRATDDPNQRNLIQIQATQAADLVVTPQGGLAYLPGIMGKRVLMLMRQGDYLDYLELERIYGSKIEVFYETKHLMLWLEQSTLK